MLHGKTAIVTGASRGIGRAIAERLGREEANVLLLARDAAALAEVARRIGPRAAWLAVDLREATAAAQRVTRVGEPEDIAGLVALIVGPEGRFLHGALIDMDGGATKSL